MCGIAGFFLPGQQAQPSAVRRMCDTILHRGPNDEGVYVSEGVGIGMRRLSIIDIAGGHQPIANEDSTIWTVYNGEIYNYRELRSQLESLGHSFRTQSDTEILVHGYEQFGTAIFSMLRGMFACAIWDERRQDLILARDRFGKKPLYYSITPEGIHFGSELKCLRAAGLPMDLDEQAIRLYFQFAYIPDPHSPFKQVQKLPAGGWLRFSHNHRVQQDLYWKLPAPVQDRPVSPAEEARWRDQILALFDEAVKIRMIADVPLGAFLSGGVDSSSVVAAMASLSQQPVQTFSIYFDEPGQPEYNESAYAQLIATKYGTAHHCMKVEADSVNLISRLVQHFDEPFADSSAVPTYLVSEFAAKHVTVALSGDGGDELFAGYDSFFAANRLNRWDALPAWSRKTLGLIADSLPYSAYGKNLLHMISRNTALERYFETTYAPYYQNRMLLQSNWLLPADDAFLRTSMANYLLPGQADVLLQALYFEATCKLTGDMLVKVDRMSMAASLEIRSPLLDHQLAELAMTIPPSARMKNGQGKSIFIEAMGQRLPAEVWQRSKRGFSVPIASWFRGPLRELLRDTLGSKRFLNRGFVSPAFLNTLIEEHDQGRRNNRDPLWKLLILECWCRQWMDPSDG